MVTAVACRLQAQRKRIDQVLARFRLTRQQLEGVRDKMRAELEYGLKRDTHKQATVKMLPTYVYGVPDGTGEPAEVPTIRALDFMLDGTVTEAVGLRSSDPR